LLDLVAFLVLVNSVQLVQGGEGHENVHAEQVPVDRNDHGRVPGPDETGARQRHGLENGFFKLAQFSLLKIGNFHSNHKKPVTYLRNADFLNRSIDVGQTGNDQAPFEGGRPEKDGLGPGRVVPHGLHGPGHELVGHADHGSVQGAHGDRRKSECAYSKNWTSTS